MQKLPYKRSHTEAPIQRLPYTSSHIYIYIYISSDLQQKFDLLEAPNTIVSNTTSVVKKHNFCLIKGGGFGSLRALENLLIPIATALLGGYDAKK